MTTAIDSMKKKGIYDLNMLDDLLTIVEGISEQKYIQAILSIQPFKPKFDVYQHNQKLKKSIENLEGEPNISKTKLAT